VTRPLAAIQVIVDMSAAADREAGEMSLARSRGRTAEVEESFRTLCCELRVIARAIEALPAELRASQPRVPWREMARLPDMLERPGFRPDGKIIRKSVERPLFELRRAAIRLRFYLVAEERRALGRERYSLSGISHRNFGETPAVDGGGEEGMPGE
jgi:uncharacterized protein with HEPN domain